MALNAQNKRFLSLLREINVDVDLFPDRTFDSLFENEQSGSDYFIEWFMENIDSENALTELEVDTYKALDRSIQNLSDDEIDFALLKYSVSYDDINSVNENYVKNTLNNILEELDAEINKLRLISLDLDLKHGEAKTKTNHVKEECNHYKQLLAQRRNELNLLNAKFAAIEKEVESLSVNYNSSAIDFTTFKASIKKFDETVALFKTKKCQCDEMPVSLMGNAEFQKLLKLNQDCVISKFLFLSTQGALKETQFKTSKAQEFLNILKNDSENYFTFDEVLNIWCESGTYKEAEVQKVEIKQLHESIIKEYTLELDSFQIQWLKSMLGQRKNDFTEFSKFIQFIKSDAANNAFLLLLIKKYMENERAFLELTNTIHCNVIEIKNFIKDVCNSLTWKNKRFQDFKNQAPARNAFLLSYRKLTSSNEGNLCESNCSFSNVAVIANTLIQDLNLYYDFVQKLQHTVSLLLSEIVHGPTNQIQVSPIEIQIQFDLCQQFLSKYSHNIQKLLTEYVNIKDTVSSSNRKKLLLWTDFLLDPRGVVKCLKELQMKSVKINS